MLNGELLTVSMSESEKTAFVLELLEQAEAKQMLIDIAESQQEYFEWHGKYSDDLEKLNLNIVQNHYEFVLESAGDKQFKVTARSKAPGVALKGAGDDVWIIDHNFNLGNPVKWSRKCIRQGAAYDPAGGADF